MKRAGDRPKWIKYDFDYLRKKPGIVFIVCCRCGCQIENKLGFCRKCQKEMSEDCIDAES